MGFASIGLIRAMGSFEVGSQFPFKSKSPMSDARDAVMGELYHLSFRVNEGVNCPRDGIL